MSQRPMPGAAGETGRLLAGRPVTRPGWHAGAALLAFARAVVLPALLLLALTVLLQARLGAYGREFDYDESSHYVTGLMFHDYLAQLAGGGRIVSPLRFLAVFHSHYPLVGLGHWPPLYYVVEALWMLMFGTGRAAMLLLSAAVTVALAMLVRHVVMRRGGAALGAAAAVAVVVCGIIQGGSAALMLDGAVALIALLSMLAYARFAAADRVADAAAWAAAFGVLAAAAMLVKGNGACLALVPPCYVLIGRRFDLLRRWTFWLPLPIAFLLAGPWTLLTYRLVAQGFRFTWGLDYTAIAASADAAFLLTSFGPVVLALAGIGFVQAWRSSDGDEIAAAALLAAVVLFLLTVPAAIQDRYLAPAAAPLLILAAAALRRVLAVGRRFSARRGMLTALALGVAAASFLPGNADLPAKRRFGLVAAAPIVWRDRIPANPAVLIVADGGGEGAAIAELAMRDPARPSLFAIRGSRLLGGGGYNTADYQPRYASAAEVMAAIDAYAVPFVLLRAKPAGNAWRHLDQVQDAIRMAPDRWQELWRREAGGETVRLFRIRGNDTRAADAGRLMSLSAPRSLGEPTPPR